MPRRRRDTMGMRKLKIKRFLKNTFYRKSNGTSFLSSTLTDMPHSHGSSSVFCAAIVLLCSMGHDTLVVTTAVCQRARANS